MGPGTPAPGICHKSPRLHSRAHHAERDGYYQCPGFFVGRGMSCTCVVGLQWGDEAKGKIVDLLADDHDFVVRYNGGNNAGHTVVWGDRTFKLSLLPTGVLTPRLTSVIGNG